LSSLKYKISLFFDTIPLIYRKEQSKSWDLYRKSNKIGENIMIWDKINFGTNAKVKNKILPLIIFIDPDWFYTQYEYKDSFLRKKFGNQAEIIYHRSRNIKPKKGHYIKYFLFSDYTSDSFLPISIEEAEKKFSDCIETGNYCQDIELFDSQQFKILKKIDLIYSRSLKKYDKKSNRIFIKDLKEYLFDGKNITEKKAVEFFENIDNFIL